MEMPGPPPELTTDAAEAAAQRLFGVTGRATPLPSERDQNFRIDAEDGTRFVLKVANRAEPDAMLNAESAVLQHLSATGLTPALVPATDGATMARHDGHRVRLVTWIDGRPMGDAPRQSDALLADLGRVVGRLDRALATFDHGALHRRFHWDLAGAPEFVAARVSAVGDPALASAIKAFLAVHGTDVQPRLPLLRRGPIHNDANDYNVLVDPAAQRVTGVVDFGDMVVSHVVNDPAVAMAYAALGKPDPIAAAAAVARGYHEAHALGEDEIAVLYGLMGLRLSLSACVATVQRAARPDDPYLGISQSAIQDTLPRLAAVHPRLAHYRFREACGLPPVPATPRVVEWLRSNRHTFAPVTGHDPGRTPILVLDLSVGSPLVASNPADNAAEPFSRRVFDAIRDAGAAFGAGGYGEARLIYSAESYAGRAATDERRTIHLGVDLTLPAGSPLYAPLDGVVHGAEDGGRFDYGPVVVLRHEAAGDPPLTFFTLYGHLDRASLARLTIGQTIRAGERFAALGAPPENGDWWPHVHVQVITDLLDVPCNFNGVAPASQRTTWLSLSPDPNLILGIPALDEVRRPASAAILAGRRAHIGPSVRLSYGDRPLRVMRGWMQYLYDETGRAYIDAYNNVPHVGHAHPAVARAVAEQFAMISTNTRYLQDVVVEYAAALAARFPAPLDVCFFTASGSEANELALRLARASTGARDVIVLEGAYHGHTTSLIDVSPYKHGGPGGEGAPSWVHVAPMPDVYRGPFKAGDPDAGAKYARAVGEIVDRLRGGGRRLSAFLAETCPSVGGQILPPPGYLAGVYSRVREAGGVCIADEVQTGFGRLGTCFWGFEDHGVVPDIVVLGKPIASGYPLGAVVTTREIADRFDTGMEFFSTFGGSTAACAAALATLRATVDEGWQAHGRRVGDHLLAGLRRLGSRHGLIGDVRGSGLFIGVELVRDRRTLEPATTEAEAIVTRLRDLGVLTGTDGPHHNVIKIRGPMPLAVSDADLVMAALDQALSEQP